MRFLCGFLLKSLVLHFYLFWRRLCQPWWVVLFCLLCVFPSTFVLTFVYSNLSFFAIFSSNPILLFFFILIICLFFLFNKKLLFLIVLLTKESLISIANKIKRVLETIKASNAIILAVSFFNSFSQKENNKS